MERRICRRHPGTTTEGALKALATRGISPVFVTMRTHTEGVAAVWEGRVDAYETDRLILVGEALGRPSTVALKLSDDYLTMEPYSLMMRRDPILRLAVNRASWQKSTAPGKSSGCSAARFLPGPCPHRWSKPSTCSTHCPGRTVALRSTRPRGRRRQRGPAAALRQPAASSPARAYGNYLPSWSRCAA
jgi:hypothetical protein